MVALIYKLMNRIVMLASVLFVKFLFIPLAGTSQALVGERDTAQLEVVVKKPAPLNRTIISAMETASIGGAAGSLVAKQMDQQAEEIRHSLKETTVERNAEGILITFQSHSLFEPDSYELPPATRTRLKSLARTMNKFHFSCAIIEVHTDNTGEEIYNQMLSDKRAKSLENFLVREGISNNRLRSKGNGNKQPLFPNSTAEERLANRRVEVAIIANDEMKAMARKGETGEFLAAKK
jgi:outer membrane protein OmpA-like peptidoglycan-associated protein